MAEKTWHVDPIEVPDDTLEHWQRITDIIARVADVPVALVMRLVHEDIEVFVSSKTEGNPYDPGDREHFFDSGLYCEHVIRTRRPLSVPDALDDPDWENNPDVRLGMIAYFGLPIVDANGNPFGTLCILDAKPNGFTEPSRALMHEFVHVLEGHLALIEVNHALGVENKRLAELAAEIRSLRRILPVCGHCGNIRDDGGYWQSLRSFLEAHAGTQYSHGICPDCFRENHPEIAAEVLGDE